MPILSISIHNLTPWTVGKHTSENDVFDVFRTPWHFFRSGFWKYAKRYTVHIHINNVYTKMYVWGSSILGWVLSLHLCGIWVCPGMQFSLGLRSAVFPQTSPGKTKTIHVCFASTPFWERTGHSADAPVQPIVNARPIQALSLDMADVTSGPTWKYVTIWGGSVGI